MKGLLISWCVHILFLCRCDRVKRKSKSYTWDFWHWIKLFPNTHAIPGRWFNHSLWFRSSPCWNPWHFEVPQPIGALVLGCCRRRVGWAQCRPHRLGGAVPAHIRHPQPPSVAEPICSVLQSSRPLHFWAALLRCRHMAPLHRRGDGRGEMCLKSQKQFTFTTSEHLRCVTQRFQPWIMTNPLSAAGKWNLSHAESSTTY